MAALTVLPDSPREADPARSAPGKLTLPMAQKARKPGHGDRASWASTGAGEEIRTLDPNLGKVMLYQLSYSRFMV